MVNKKSIFIASCAAILFFGMAITTLGSVLPDLKLKFQLDDIGAGTLFSILPFGILAGSLVFGPIADRHGFRLILVIACFSMAAGFGGITLSPRLLLLQVCVFLFGFGGGIINGGTSALISDISDTGKGANLSLLGVFFGAGALGMPSALAFLRDFFFYTNILLIVGALTLIIGLYFLTIKFPPAKQASGAALNQSLKLLRDPFLLVVSFFLFFQSGFEGLVNNWTPHYLNDFMKFPFSSSLVVLSFSVGGLTVMRILLGTILKKWSSIKIWLLTFILLGAGLVMIKFSQTYYPVLIGFIFCGGGLAAGFPIMLGYVGQKFKDLSGTAFSIAFSVGLVGNMIINYSMGVVSQKFGIGYWTTFGWSVFMIMAVLCVLILHKIYSQAKE